MSPTLKSRVTSYVLSPHFYHTIYFDLLVPYIQNRSSAPSAHTSSLEWKAASNKIPEIKNMLMTLSGISSYFAKSRLRCKELKHIVEYNDLIVCTFLQIFEIRWSEFTHQLVESILKSWNALIMHFNSTTYNEARGFSTYLCN